MENTYCIIPDSFEPFWQLADSIDISEHDKDTFRSSVIERVYINAGCKSWDIHLKTPQLLTQYSLSLLSDSIRRGCQLEQVKITQYLDNPELEKFTVDLVHKYLQEHFFDKIPQVMISEVVTKFPEVYIMVLGDVTLDVVREYGIEASLAAYLQANLKTEFKELKVIIKKSIVERKVKTSKHNSADSKQPDKHIVVSAPPEPSSRTIWGKIGKGAIKEITEVTQEENKISVQGYLCNLQKRELRTKRVLLSFDVVDKSDGISCKIFFKDAQEYDSQASKIKEGLFVQVFGNVAPDKFARDDLVMSVLGIQTIPEEKRSDNSPEKRVELHLHTKMSSLDALVNIKDAIKTAAKFGHPAVAVTDHGVVQAFPEAYEVAAKSGIKLIFGMEGYLIEDENTNKSWHIIILAKNPDGLRNLYRLVSCSHLNHYHKRPRIPRSVLMEHREGLILGSACEAGELYQAYLDGKSEEEIQAIAEFYDYLEIQPLGNNHFLLRNGILSSEQELKDINVKICELGKKLDKMVVATCDVHFLNPEDEVFRRILMTGQGYSDADLQPPLYFRTTQEMLDEFAYLGKELAYEVVVSNTRAIAEQFESFKPIPDELYAPKIDGAEESVRQMSYEMLNSLYERDGVVPELILERLEMELNSIINNGFAVLYLIAHKLVKKSLDDGYLVGSRGSVGSSFVATMMRITEVNPLKPHWRCPDCKFCEFILDGSYNSGFDLPPKDCPHCGVEMIRDGHDIPFAVFMGFHGDKVPDIDLNFSGEYQPVAHKYTEELFGKDNVFRAGTISTLADKTAYGFVKKYHEQKNLHVREAKINSLVGGCTGVKRTTGQHPGGVMVVPHDMDVHFFTPLQHPADDKDSGVITTHFDYHSISERLVKLDILGHDDPTVIRMLEDITGINAMKIPVNDPPTMSLFHSCEALGVEPAELNSNVGTFGIPEFGTKFVRQMLEDIKPSRFSELVRVSGFSHGTDVWLNNAQDLIRSGTANVSETISARDDIMVYLIQKGLDPSMSFKIMEGVRKGRGVDPKQVEAMKAQDVPDWYIESCQKIKYMFPKAHAVAYVMMAYRIAYCKIHYPMAFYAAYFTVRATEFDAELITKGKEILKSNIRLLEQKGNEATAKEKSLLTILEIALEMLLRGFEFLPIDLYNSDAQKFLIVDGKLLPPLSALQGVGGNAADNIVEARAQGEFSSKQDLAQRARVSKTVVDKLSDYGCLNGLPDTNQISLFE